MDWIQEHSNGSLSTTTVWDRPTGPVGDGRGLCACVSAVFLHGRGRRVEVEERAVPVHPLGRRPEQPRQSREAPVHDPPLESRVPEVEPE